MTAKRNAARPVSDGRTIRILSAADLASDPEAWDGLVARALAPHPYFSRHVIEAHRAAGLLPADLACVTVWSGDRLDAVLPFRTRLDIVGLGRLVARPALSPFMPSSAPLVAEEGFAASLDALVAGLAQASRGRSWRWPLLTVSGTVGEGLLRALDAAGWAVAEIAAFERPVLHRYPDHDAFLTGHPHRSRLKDLRRRGRRLAERGRIGFETVTGGAALERARDAFLALEASGWKGAAGTALACRPKTRALARALFVAQPGPVGVQANLLSLDERPLAISLSLLVRGTAFLLKTAFDEGERAYGPGLLLESEIVRACHETGFADKLDSATLPGSALETLYRERETVAEIVAVPPGADGVAIARRVAFARVEHRARASAKRVLGRG